MAHQETQLIRKPAGYEDEFSREAEGPTHRTSGHEIVKAQLFPPHIPVAEWARFDLDLDDIKDVAVALWRYKQALERDLIVDNSHRNQEDNFTAVKVEFIVRRILTSVRQG